MKRTSTSTFHFCITLFTNISGLKQKSSTSQSYLRWINLVVWSFVLFLLPTTSVLGQDFDLNPEKWFPLDVGSQWHYHFGNNGFPIDVVRKAEQDSIVDGRTWVKINDIFCRSAIPADCATPQQRWFRFTEDRYLLFNDKPELATADTMLLTQPQSIFTIDIPHDTLQTPLFPQDSVLLAIETNDAGNEADSTHLLLSVHANALFQGSFVYKVGDNVGLVGALVGDISYGDTTLIRSVALPVEEYPTIGKTVIDIYPNPSKGKTTIRVRAQRSGRYELTIYNLLGQRVHQAHRRLSINQEWRLIWEDEPRMPSNIYFVHLMSDGNILTTKGVVLTK